LLFVVGAAAQCSSCNAVAETLGHCHLPDIGTNYTSLPSAKTQRNVSGILFDYPLEVGPSTFELVNYTQADCLCSKHTKDLDSCANCLNSTTANGTKEDNYRRVAEVFLEDCKAFGYYPNNSIAYPSTTRTITPLQTGSLTGCNICGIIGGQLDECNLEPLTATPPKGTRTIRLGTDDSEYTAYLLFNRTAGECFCTLPVLNLFFSCQKCIGEGPALQMINYYRTDCHTLGYWSEADVKPGAVTYEKPPANATASSRSTAGRIGFACSWWRFGALLFVCVLML